MFSDTAALLMGGRCFICSECPKSVQKLRRCHEDRFDFKEADGSFWPIQLTPAGGQYGFCPSKALRDIEATSIYQLLVITAETGQLAYPGCLSDQPEWYIDILSWFLARYNELRFYSRARAILGDGKK